MANKKDSTSAAGGSPSSSPPAADASDRSTPPLLDDDQQRRHAARREFERNVIQSARGMVALTELVRAPKANDPAFTLLLGAGASVSSGVPTAGGMIDYWKKLLFREYLVKEQKALDEDETRNERAFLAWERTAYRRWLGHRKAYEALFEYFFPEAPARQMHIENLVSRANPTFGYLYLAGLINSGRFSRILTTNFDELVVEALYRFYGIRAYSLAFDSALSSVRLDSPRPKVFKLHGDFLYDNIRNLRREVSRLDVLMEEKLYRVCAESGLIVIGYSGGDSSVMGPIRDMLRREEYLRLGVHWCVVAPPGKEEGVIPEEVLSLLSEYPDDVHVYIIPGFDQLMEELFNACKCRYPGWLDDPRNSSAFTAFNDACAEFGLLVKTATMANNLRRWSRLASEGGISFKVLLTLAQNEWSVGRSKFDEIYSRRRAGISETDLLQLTRETLEAFESAREMLFPALLARQEFDPDVTFTERVRAHGRALGILTGIIECRMLLNVEMTSEIADEFERHCRVAEDDEANADHAGLSKSDQHRASFNEVSGNGILVTAKLRPISDALVKVTAALRRLRRYDRDEELLNELRDPEREPCCRAILHLLVYP